MNDFRYALRTHLESPAYTVVVLTLPLGIGAKSTIFSLTEQVLPPHAAGPVEGYIPVRRLRKSIRCGPRVPVTGRFQSSEFRFQRTLFELDSEI